MRPEEKIIQSFFDAKKNTLYFNELVASTNLSHSSLQNNLKKLINKNILRTEKSKAHRFYIINDLKFTALEFSQKAHQKFEQLHRSVRIPLTDFLKRIPRHHHCVVLFGSASRGMQKNGSDIDLLIVTEHKKESNLIKKDIDAISKYPLSIFECSVKEFIKNEDHLIIQARQTGFPIFGEQFFYEVQLDEHQRTL